MDVAPLKQGKATFPSGYEIDSGELQVVQITWGKTSGGKKRTTERLVQISRGQIHRD